jgi:hypothetical protein
MIISNVSTYDFHNAFNAMSPDDFSYDALEALYTYLDDLSDDIGEPIELDVIAICCDFAEYSSLEELQGDYCYIESLGELQDNTTVLELANGGLVIQQF